jgi:hypothetical protein
MRLPDGPAVGFLRPAELVLHEGAGPGVVRSARDATEAQTRAVVELGGTQLDAEVAPGAMLDRGATCWPELLGGLVCPASAPMGPNWRIELRRISGSS